VFLVLIIYFLTNRGSGGGECELKEPTNELFTRGEISQKEVRVTDEPLLRGIGTAICKGEAYRPLV
jgi:hypothetical protein